MKSNKVAAVACHLGVSDSRADHGQRLLVYQLLLEILGLLHAAESTGDRKDLTTARVTSGSVHAGGRFFIVPEE